MTVNETTHRYRIFVVFLAGGDRERRRRRAATLDAEMTFAAAEAKLKPFVAGYETRGTIVGYGIEPVSEDEDD